MKASDLVESLKHFFFDIIGFLIPGFVTVLLLSIVVDQAFYQNINTPFTGMGEWRTFTVLILSYIVGYIIYSIAALRDMLAEAIRIDSIREFYKKKKDKQIMKPLGFFLIELPEDINAYVSKTYEYETSIVVLKKIQNSQEREVTDKIEKLEVQQARSLIISYVPDAQSQIYHFMFRSEICNFLNASFLSISFLGLLSILINVLSNGDLVFIIKPDFKTLYVILFASSIFLHKTRIRFLKIAFNMPFHIFISKYYKFP